MCSRNVTFIALAIFLILFCDTTSSECTMQGPCICTLPDGHYYNLTSLAHEKPLTASKDNMTVYFHPCTNVQISVDKNNTFCANGTHLSLCLQKNHTTQNLGIVGETHMILSENKKFPTFEIHHDSFKSVINIVCCTDPAVDSKIDFSTSYPDQNKYNFILTSPHGCKLEPNNKGLSTGSILVILLFTFTGIYFIGGIMALKLLRGATGWEMLPNHKFWCELPSLVRDGIVYTFNCCRGDSYERI